MQVQEVGQEGLKHSFTVKVSQAESEKALVERLEEIAKTARVQGFRPGKAPLAIIRQRFGAEERLRVLDKTVNDSIDKVLGERKLRPAFQPKVEMVNFAEDKDLEFKFDVEVMPEIPSADYSKLGFERSIAEVPESAIDDAIVRIAHASREPESIAEKRAAKMGDIAVINFDGTVDGVAHPGMKADDHRLELGSKSFIGTFEEQIVGMKAGDKKNVKVDFPADYHAANLAGKAAVFAVELKELRAQKAVEMNAALAEELGFKTLEELRKRIAEEIGAEYARVSRTVLKRKLLDHLAETQKFPVPEGMIEGEFTEIWKQVQQEKAQGTLSKEDAKKSDDALRKEYREISERRIRLGLLLSDLAHKNKVEVSPPELRNAMIAEARRFPGQEKAVLEYFTKTPNAVDRLRAPILEEKVVDFILAQAKITEKKVSVDALMKLVEEID